MFLESVIVSEPWRAGGFLTYHARVLLCIAHGLGVRLRDIAAPGGGHRRATRRRSDLRSVLAVDLLRPLAGRNRRRRYRADEGGRVAHFMSGSAARSPRLGACMLQPPGCRDLVLTEGPRRRAAPTAAAAA